MNDSPGLTVIFTKDLNSEQAKQLGDAIAMMKGVECVMLGTYENASEMMQKMQVKRKLLNDIYQLIDRS